MLGCDSRAAAGALPPILLSAHELTLMDMVQSRIAENVEWSGRAATAWMG